MDGATLDARGHRCPLPVILMEAALRRMPEGARLRVVADDPIAAIDIPHFCREGGHGCERVVAEEGICVFQVTAGQKPRV